MARLGEFTTHWKFAADPKPAAAASLEEPLTELARRHGLDPPGEVLHVNPVNGERRTAPAIEGTP